MKVNELNNLSMEELHTKEMDLTKELFNLRFQLHTGRLENTSKPSLIKKDIARVKTVLREKRS